MSDEQPAAFDEGDLEAWKVIVEATGVDRLVAALQRIGLKAGMLVPNVPNVAPAPDGDQATNGKGTRARRAAAVKKEGN